MPDYPLSYSLQSRSRECVSYTDAPAHTGPKRSDNYIYVIIITGILIIIIVILLIYYYGITSQP